MLTRYHTHSDDEQWAPVSDLMAVVMLIFMLISMILLVYFDLDKKSNIERCDETRELLEMEFNTDFKQWNTELKEDLTIQFKNIQPDIKSTVALNEQTAIDDFSSIHITTEIILFTVSQTTPSAWFSDKIGKFFPRYMDVIKEIKTKFGDDEILAIRVEGHTSSEYENSKDIEEAFIKNMKLSQDRAREIIKNALELPEAENYQHIVRQQVKADGLSSSKLICVNGQEDKNSSRRVEFKLLTNSCQKAGIYDKAKPLTNSCGDNI